MKSDRSRALVGLTVSAVVAAYEGGALVLGYFLLTVPGFAFPDVTDQSGPTWVLIVGLVLVAYGTAVVLWGLAHAKRRGPPLYEVNLTRPPLWLENERLWRVLAGIMLALPLCLVSVVAKNNSLRAVPAAFGVGAVVVVTLLARTSASASGDA